MMGEINEFQETFSTWSRRQDEKRFCTSGNDTNNTDEIYRESPGKYYDKFYSCMVPISLSLKNGGMKNQGMTSTRASVLNNEIYNMIAKTSKYAPFRQYSLSDSSYRN